MKTSSQLQTLFHGSLKQTVVEWYAATPNQSLKLMDEAEVQTRYPQEDWLVTALSAGRQLSSNPFGGSA